MRPHLELARYAVIGNPIAHSLSPLIHGRFAAQTGQSMDYTRILCAPGEFDRCLDDFSRKGGQGCNVTMPFKFDAFRLASRRSERAELAGAANTLTHDGAAWVADNTDGAGLMRDIEVGAGVALAGLRVLLIGAGGAAAGVLGPLLETRPGSVIVANRSPEKAARLIQHHQALAGRVAVSLAATGLDEPGQAFDVVINASASSLHGMASPVPPAVLREGTLALDLAYGAAARPFLAWAEAAGARGHDGLGMLVEQAALAFEHWRGVRPDTRPVLAAMRQELAARP